MRQLATRFLDGLDIRRCLGKAEHGGGIKIYGGAAGHVVEDNGEWGDSFGEGQKVLKLAFLGRLVVVGIGRQHRVDAANLLEQLGVSQESARGVVSAACPHGNTSGSGVRHDADRKQPFLFIECGGLAGGPAGHEEIDACIDLPVDQGAHCLFIN